LEWAKRSAAAGCPKAKEVLAQIQNEQTSELVNTMASAFAEGVLDNLLNGDGGREEARQNAEDAAWHKREERIWERNANAAEEARRAERDYETSPNMRLP
jgi:hypothetical protein